MAKDSLFTQVERLVQSQLYRTRDARRKTLPPFPCFLVSIFASCFGRCQRLFFSFSSPSVVELSGNSRGLCEQVCERAEHDWSVREACETAADMRAEDWNALPWLDRAKERRSGERERKGVGGWVCGKQWVSLEENEGIKFIGAMGAGKYGTPHISTNCFFLITLWKVFWLRFPHRDCTLKM